MKKAIISFTHTNYCIRSAGTEKFVRNISETLQNQGYAHLNFFSFYDDKKKMKTKLVGVNYNDCFQGVYKYSEIKRIIDKYSIKKNLSFSAIHLQHILHHDLELLEQIICELRIPVCYIVHDYYILCESLKLINSKGCFCGVSVPDTEKCCDCQYQEKAIIHWKRMYQFIQGIFGQLNYIVTPSDYVTRNLKSAIPFIREIIVTRPHLVTEGLTVLPEVSKKKLRIGFAGGQFPEKGYHKWKELVSKLSESNLYEFVYLGSGRETVPNVQNVFVSTAVQGEDAMVNAVKDRSIDLVFLWPNWPETYSYVYYELAVAGAYILTNAGSGNIAEAVKKNQNGIVFDDFEACIDWLRNRDCVIDAINSYRKFGEYRPKAYLPNSDLGLFVGSGVIEYTATKQKKTYCSIILTLLYKIKYHKRINMKRGKV